MKIPNILKLNPKDIIRDYEISIGFAKSYYAQMDTKLKRNNYTLPSAATYYRRAAANLLLLEHFSEAKDLFQNASAIYQELGMPYSVAMASLASSGRKNENIYSNEWLDKPESQLVEDSIIPQLAYVVLDQVSHIKSQDNSTEKIARMRKYLESYRLYRIGILGISIGSILDIIDALVPDFENRKVDIVEALAPSLTAYNSALIYASQKRYLWKKMALPFHPAEPDIYSLLALTNSALRQRKNISIQSFVDEVPISNYCKHLVTSILDGILRTDRRINIYQLVKSVINFRHNSEARQRLEFRTNFESLKEVEILCDETEFKSAFGHILDNAIKYSRIDLSKNRNHQYVNINGYIQAEMVVIEFQSFGINVLLRELSVVQQNFFYKEQALEGKMSGSIRELWSANAFIEKIGGSVNVDYENTVSVSSLQTLIISFPYTTNSVI